MKFQFQSGFLSNGHVIVPLVIVIVLEDFLASMQDLPVTQQTLSKAMISIACKKANCIDIKPSKTRCMNGSLRLLQQNSLGVEAECSSYDIGNIPKIKSWFFVQSVGLGL